MARPTITSQYGKCTEELKVGIDEQSKEALTALAFLAGKSVSEYIRDLLHLHVYGHAAVARSRSEVREQGRE